MSSTPVWKDLFNRNNAPRPPACGRGRQVSFSLSFLPAGLPGSSEVPGEMRAITSPASNLTKLPGDTFDVV